MIGRITGNYEAVQCDFAGRPAILQAVRSESFMDECPHDHAHGKRSRAQLLPARTSCEISGHPPDHHFVGVTKMVDLDSRSQRGTEKLTDVVFERTGSNQNFAPTIILKAKDFATEITIFNARQNDMKSESTISREHVTNNQAVRNTLLERGIRPESLSPSEDVKKVERHLATEERKTLKNPDALPSED